MAAKPAELTEKDFKKKVLNSKVPFLVFFSSSSSVCRMLEPQLLALAEEWKGKIGFGKLDANHFSKVARDFSISTYPTLLFFKEGRITARIIGSPPREEIKEQLEEHIS